MLYITFPLRFKNYWKETDLFYRIWSLFITRSTNSLITDASVWSQCINSCKALMITALWSYSATQYTEHNRQQEINSSESTWIPSLLAVLVCSIFFLSIFNYTRTSKFFLWFFFLQPGVVIIRMYSICSAYYMLIIWLKKITKMYKVKVRYDPFFLKFEHYS